MVEEPARYRSGRYSPTLDMQLDSIALPKSSAQVLAQPPLPPPGLAPPPASSLPQPTASFGGAFSPMQMPFSGLPGYNASPAVPTAVSNSRFPPAKSPIRASPQQMPFVPAATVSPIPVPRQSPSKPVPVGVVQSSFAPVIPRSRAVIVSHDVGASDEDYDSGTTDCSLDFSSESSHLFLHRR